MHQTILPLIINHANLSNKLICRYKYQNMHRHIFYASIPMDEIRNMNVLISQLGTSCSFDSPGLARNEPTLDKHPQGDSTP